MQEPAVAALLLAKAALARERGVRVRLDGDSRVGSGGDDLITVLGNLIDNAVDATGHGGEALIRVIEDDAGVMVQVDDNGPGVPEQQRDRVFQAGVTTKDCGQGPHGRGVGLALVARIAECRGGSARMTRSPLGGARVEVRLCSEEAL